MNANRTADQVVQTEVPKPLDWYRKRYFGERTAVIDRNGLSIVDEYNRFFFKHEEARELQKWLNANLPI